jgi:hypothetical protein
MPNIFLKKSSVAGKVPVVGDLAFGELALNYSDGKLYYKTAGNLINYIANGGTFTTALSITSSTQATSTTTGALVVTGGVGIGRDLWVGGLIESLSTSQSISTTTGAIQVIGGVGIGGSVYVGSRVGWVNATNQSAVYQVYNTTTNSLDTIFA